MEHRRATNNETETPIDADYLEMLGWTEVLHDDKSKIFRVDVNRADARRELVRADVEELVGKIIVVEGGIGQGKTTIVRELKSVLDGLGISCWTGPEPIDQRSLELFMKFAVGIDTATAPTDRVLCARNAAKRMQFTMLRNRMANAKRAGEESRSGHVAFLDRGPFGDAAFMHITFTRYGVSGDASLRYMAEFQRRYLDADFPTNGVAVLRMKAPVEVTYGRWLERERAVGGHKYDLGYMGEIERAHDRCSEGWGDTIEYDNSVDIADGPDDRPSDVSVRAVLLTLRDYFRAVAPTRPSSGGKQ